MDEKTYIKKKICCPSCKNEIEFSIKLKNVNITSIKINTKCSSCGSEIILTPSSLIGVDDEKKDLDRIEIDEEKFEEIEIPSDINTFFDDVEEKINKEQNEVEENRKTREYINDIFS